MSEDARDATLREAAAELYAVVPADFTAARNAKAAGAVKDAVLSRAIKAFRKPVVAAWVVGELVRSGGDDLGDALALAADLREAQEDLDARALARLGRERRALVSALARKAAEFAEARGVSVSASVRDDVEKTLNAAMLDEAAAAAVLSGRLTRPLEPNGVDPVDLADAVAGGLDGVKAGATSAAQTPARDDLAERRARREAEKAVREADRAASEAERAVAGLEKKAEAARQRADLVGERVDALRAELARVEREADAADTEAAELERERKSAVKAAADARTAAERAASKLESLKLESLK